MLGGETSDEWSSCICRAGLLQVLPDQHWHSQAADIDEKTGIDVKKLIISIVVSEYWMIRHRCDKMWRT
jgi:hypothetical protein